MDAKVRIRTNEVLSAITAFGKVEYPRVELLPELFLLQRQLAEIVFSNTHAEISKIRIRDIEDHLEQLNEKCGHPEDELLSKVKEGGKAIYLMIKSELSGNAGEKKANWSLDTVRCKNVRLKNVEFKSGDHRTELDCIMFTNKAIFIIEVKNTGKDIYIDERGNYCRVGNTMSFDKNIGEKMNEKEYLLREALKSVDVPELNIVSLVVFTNNDIRVDNNYPYITTCFLSSLPNIIDKYEGESIYSDKCINEMVEGVRSAECKEAYPLPIDMKQFKEDFATLLATLEIKSASKAEANDEVAADNNFSDENVTPSVPDTDYFSQSSPDSPNIFSEKPIYIITAGVALTIISMVGAVIYKTIKK